MRKFMALFRRELAGVFLAPLGYVTVAIFMSATGWTFLQAAQAQVGGSLQLEALHAIALLFWMPVLITVVCMRLFAEEKRAGTIETLLTTAVGDATVVLAKYCGAMFFVLVGLAGGLGSLPLLVWMAPGIESVDLSALLGGGDRGPGFLADPQPDCGRDCLFLGDLCTLDDQTGAAGRAVGAAGSP